jgi:lysophospholipase L1-like esterase
MTDRRPVVRAPEQAWQRLGELLQLRRADLGYRRRPAFTRDRGINIRLVTDIENAYRPNTFLTPTLRDIAQAYQVTYDSLIAVLAGKEDELSAAAPAPAGGWVPPVTDPDSEAAIRPYFDPVNEHRIALAARGITSPSGAQMFGEGAEDAMTWDGVGARLEIRDRVWLIAELRRNADRRNAPEARTNGR